MTERPTPSRAPRARLAAALALAAAALLPAAAAAQIALKPASPQPAADALSPGLAVDYAYPGDIRFLGQADTALRREGEAGPPIVGLDYPDGGEGAPVLTSERTLRVAAAIRGYLRFDQAGTWRLEVHSNDGIDLAIGGAKVDKFDGRRRCESNGWIEVEVPEPGWYPVRAIYFQRLGTSCLMMRWEKPDGMRQWTPRTAWAYAE